MKPFVTYIMLFVLSAAAFAQEYGTELTDASAFLSGLRSALSWQTGVSADFVQTKKVKMMKDVQTSRGTFMYQKEANIVVLGYTEPAGNKIVITGDRISVTTGGRQTDLKAKSSPALSQLSDMIKVCLTGDFAALDSKMDTRYYVDGSIYTLVMTPKLSRTKRYIAEVVLRFDNRDKTLRLMRLTEANGDYQQYEYTNVIPVD